MYEARFTAHFPQETPVLGLVWMHGTSCVAQVAQVCCFEVCCQAKRTGITSVECIVHLDHPWQASVRSVCFRWRSIQGHCDGTRMSLGL